jgi:hypothetical protein
MKNRLLTFFVALFCAVNLWADDSGSCGGGLTWNYNSTTASLAITTLPLAARNLQEGMSAEQGLRAGTPRRTIIHDGGGEDNYGDDNLRPSTNPTDPFFTPVGSMPWLWMLLIAALYILAVRRSRT